MSRSFHLDKGHKFCYTIYMSHPDDQSRVGYTRAEFNAIFQIYSTYVYSGLFRDFTFAPGNGRYFISFREEAGKTPLVTIEKRRLGPDTALFVATTPGPRGQLREIARSEKIGAFTEQLRGKIAMLEASRTSPGRDASNAGRQG